MKRKSPGKALTRTARDVKDSDEFVAHIASIAELYRREHALDATPRGSAVRQSLKVFRKHADALSQWLKQAQQRPSAAEHDALDKVGSVLYGAAHHAHTASKGVAEWLVQAEAAAGRCLEDPRLLPRKAQPNAPRLAGAALRATFEHHKLKFSAQVGPEKHSDAVRLLCAIAKHAGDLAFTPAAARQALLESGERRRKPAA